MCAKGPSFFLFDSRSLEGVCIGEWTVGSVKSTRVITSVILGGFFPSISSHLCEIRRRRASERKQARGERGLVCSPKEPRPRTVPRVRRPSELGQLSSLAFIANHRPFKKYYIPIVYRDIAFSSCSFEHFVVFSRCIKSHFELVSCCITQQYLDPKL